MATISRYPLADDVFRYLIVWDDIAGNQQSKTFDTREPSLQFLTLFEPPPESPIKKKAKTMARRRGA